MKNKEINLSIVSSPRHSTSYIFDECLRKVIGGRSESIFNHSVCIADLRVEKVNIKRANMAQNTADHKQKWFGFSEPVAH